MLLFGNSTVVWLFDTTVSKSSETVAATLIREVETEVVELQPGRFLTAMTGKMQQLRKAIFILIDGRSVLRN